jgi:hypothetical protein
MPSFELKKARNSNHLSRDQDALFRVKKGKKFKSLEQGPRYPLSDSVAADKCSSDNVLLLQRALSVRRIII